MKKVIVTGASGFIGYHLVKKLISENVFVYAIVRPQSRNMYKLQNLKNVSIVELEISNIMYIDQLINEKCDIFYHLAWDCENFDFQSQMKNVNNTLEAVKAAKILDCKRFVGTGSQAEYGQCDGLITEENIPSPQTAYGSAKLAACYLSKYCANELKLEWVWGRIFSVYGPGDKKSSLISYLINSFKNGESPEVTSGKQIWDYLYVEDAADALHSLGETDHINEIYNIANGNIHLLKYYILQVHELMKSNVEILYKKDEVNRVQLNICINKLRIKTGWNPKVTFDNGISATIDFMRKTKSELKVLKSSLDEKEVIKLLDNKNKCNKIPGGGVNK